MIPNLKTVSIETNIDDAETFEFSIDQDAMAHIMSVLTNLYSDPMMAVIREYIINGIDSHVEAGNTAPVEVTTPGSLEPTFRVRDYGVGLNVDGMRNVYSRYGASTKRGTNEQSGMLGIGSKSAMTISNQFTVTGYKDGIRTVGIVSLNESGVPEFLIIDTSSTDEPNGVLVEVPVSDPTGFNRKLNEFARFVEPGKMLLNGAPTEGHGLTPLGENLYYSDLYSYSDTATVDIIMGNVKYATNIGVPFLGRKKVYWRVPIGTVQVTPDREGIIASKDFTEMAQMTVKAAVADMVRKAYASKPKDYAAMVELTRSSTWLHHLHSRNKAAIDSLVGTLTEPTFKGLPVFTTMNTSCNLPADTFGWTLNIYNDSSTSNKTHSVSFPSSVENFKSRLIVTGLSDDKRYTRPSTGLRNKIRKYMDDNGMMSDGALVYVLNEDIDHPWLTGIKRVSLEEVSKIKVPRANTGKSSGPAPFTVYKLNTTVGRVLEEDVLDFSGYKKVVYGTVTEFGIKANQSSYNSYRFREIAETFGVDAFVVCPSNRINRLMRLCPNAQSVHMFTTQTAAALRSQIESVNRYGGTMAFNMQVLYDNRDAVLDPNLRDMVDLYQKDKSAAKSQKQYHDKMSVLSQSVTHLKQAIGIPSTIFFVDEGNQVDKVDGYRALSQYPFGDNEALLYVNAVYQDRIKEKK